MPRGCQDDLAYEAEVSRSYLSQIEKGAFYASLKIVGRLAKALDVEPVVTPHRRWRGSHEVGRQALHRCRWS
jgi:transcriptional regulator with XRE-family HTH domain